ncbi:lipid phosphate phosphatase epsilon 1, chloroplastic-like [Lycium barbarum]|uniref:lipid phosphate phosphatase epsilon 1, chloroplastic-like n=1 Tax=Lycium barbarum TaxID=112863 RepID=UPI00293E51F4|nr:lipid phosphate phosphatase epsilon 1, chloroplastic-like [Lycium barbarum]
MSTPTALVISPFVHCPKPKSFSISKLNFHLQFKPLFRNRRYPSPTMADSVRCQVTVGDEGVGEVGSLEQEALIDGFSNSASGGLNATLNSLSKWLVAAVFGVIVLWRHDGEALWAASGSVLNVGLSNVLKRILNQERPFSTMRSDPGMPSSHAQSIFYTVMFCIVSMVEYFGLNGITAVISALIFAIGSYFSWLRVSQKLHTTSQVAVGAAVGFSFSVFWFWLWNAIVLKAFMSHLWVQLSILLGTAAICISFLLYVVRYWVLEQN